MLETPTLVLLLQVVAVLQLGVTVLNFFLPKVLHWEQDLAALPLLLREVFHVHLWFISITCAIFGALTWRFAEDLANHSSELCIWVAACIGMFWGIRTVIQLVYYSSSHWKGKPLLLLAHIGFTLGYSGLSAVYLIAAFG